MSEQYSTMKPVGKLDFCFRLEGIGRKKVRKIDQSQRSFIGSQALWTNSVSAVAAFRERVWLPKQFDKAI
jgi:hypothetical protein